MWKWPKVWYCSKSPSHLPHLIAWMKNDATKKNGFFTSLQVAKRVWNAPLWKLLISEKTIMQVKGRSQDLRGSNPLTQYLVLWAHVIPYPQVILVILSHIYTQYDGMLTHIHNDMFRNANARAAFHPISDVCRLLQNGNCGVYGWCVRIILNDIRSFHYRYLQIP